MSVAACKPKTGGGRRTGVLSRHAHNHDKMRAEPNGSHSSGDTKKWKALSKQNVLSPTDRPISYITGEQVQTSVERIPVII